MADRQSNPVDILATIATKMDMHFFFKGALDREEVASAWLATLLEQHAGFRGSFLELIGLDPSKASSADWRVQVEKDAHDVNMESQSAQTAIVIENKVRSGAIQRGQLERYYRKAKRDHPTWRVAMVFLTPVAGVGAEEERRLQEGDILETGDTLFRTSWTDLGRLVENIPPTDSLRPLAVTGLAAIQRVITQSQQEKYPLVGGREIIERIVDDAENQLKQRLPQVRWKRWRGRDFHEVLNAYSDYTIWAALVFKPSDETPPQPVGLCQPDGIHVTLRVQVQLSAQGSKNRVLRSRWDNLVKTIPVRVDGVGPLVRRDRAWLCHAEPIVGSEDVIANRLADLAAAILSWAQG